MITKEEHIQNRLNSNVNFELAYKMYEDLALQEFKMNYSDFVQLFNFWITIPVSLENYFRYWDNKFELVYLLDKQNKLIKIL